MPEKPPYHPHRLCGELKKKLFPINHTEQLSRPGLFNNRIRLRLRAIYPYSLCCVYRLEYSTNSATIKCMANITEILSQMRKNPKGIKFTDLCKVCDSYFGKPRQSGSSHRVYKTPWVGDPRVNIQNNKGKAKPYQVRQVLQAVERMEVDKND